MNRYCPRGNERDLTECSSDLFYYSFLSAVPSLLDLLPGHTRNKMLLLSAIENDKCDVLYQARYGPERAVHPSPCMSFLTAITRAPTASSRYSGAGRLFLVIRKFRSICARKPTRLAPKAAIPCRLCLSAAARVA